MLITNGFPKSGIHALVKACQLLGQPCQTNHLIDLPEHTHHILIIRDPRNIVISWLRFKGLPVTPGMFITYFRQFNENSLAEEMSLYEKFLSNKDTLIVKFENLVKDDNEMKRIAAYLDVPYIEGAFEDLPGFTKTWTGRLSDYKELWCPEIDKVWKAEGGDELLLKWGYSWN